MLLGQNTLCVIYNCTRVDAMCVLSTHPMTFRCLRPFLPRSYPMPFSNQRQQIPWLDQISVPA